MHKGQKQQAIFECRDSLERGRCIQLQSEDVSCVCDGSVLDPWSPRDSSFQRRKRQKLTETSKIKYLGCSQDYCSIVFWISRKLTKPWWSHLRLTRQPRRGNPNKNTVEDNAGWFLSTVSQRILLSPFKTFLWKFPSHIVVQLRE